MTPIDVLPDDVLLEIFYFYLFRKFNHIWGLDAWQTLVHVSRRWRCIVFESPRHLNLLLVCTSRTPARECLDVWPALPLFVQGDILTTTSVDNIVAALGHRDRVCQIDLHGVTRGLQWDEVLAAMQVPFPALTRLLLLCKSEQGLVIPDTFLGGSAPRLQYLYMNYIPFPGIQNLLLSATHLTNLELYRIPRSGYTSPKAMATCLSALTSLDTLSLSNDTLSSQSRRRPPPVTRSILPNLKHFGFRGASEYLDDLVSRIDAPRLDYFCITFSHELEINLDSPHLVQFISRTPRFEEPNEAHIGMNTGAVVQLRWASDNYRRLSVNISCDWSHPLVSSMAKICAMCLPPLPTVENLRFRVPTDTSYPEPEWKDYVENSQWLELLRPFTAVKSLYLSEGLQPDMASVLQELVGDRTMEVLPSLQNIFLARFEPSRPFQETIGPFVAAREGSGHPIAVLPLYADN